MKTLRHRRKNFDFAAKRRREIVLHARHVGAAETEDFDRWLLMLALHNPGAKDQVYYLMRTSASRIRSQLRSRKGQSRGSEPDDDLPPPQASRRTSQEPPRCYRCVRSYLSFL